MKLCKGKWHKNNFTNGDVVQLIAVMKERNLGHDSAKCFYDIVKSQHDTSMEMKKLFRKALSVYMQSQAVVNPRRSRRSAHRSSAPASTERKSKCIC